MFYRIFGRNGCGKTQYIFDELKKCVDEKAKAFLIVPEQSAVITEKQVIERLGNKSNLYVEVINFKRLCNRVFRETGGLTGKSIGKGEEKLIMANVLCDIAPMLSEYSASAANPDFVQKALSGVNELKVCGIDDEKLKEAIAEISKTNENPETVKKLSDLMLISSAYDAAISRLSGVNADIYERLCEKLCGSDFFCGSRVFIDSFYGFTAQELKVISHIAEMADDTFVTFMYDGKTGDEIFTRSIRGAAECKKTAEKCGCELCDVYLDSNKRHSENSAIYEFEKNFCSDILALSKQCDKSLNGIQVYLCRDIFGEAMAALSTVFSLVRSGSRYSDICICAKNTGDYAGVIDAVFSKNNVPLGFDSPKLLSDSPLFSLVLSAIEGALTKSQSAILQYVKTGLSGLTDEEADTFETYVRTWNIDARLFRRDEDFAMNPDGYTDTHPDVNTLNVVNSARSKLFNCLNGLESSLKSAKKLSEFCYSVWKLLQDIAKESDNESFDDGNGGIDKDLLCNMLDGMVECAGDRNVTVSEFTGLIKLCAEEYNTGHIPESSDEVRFSSVDLMRASNIKHVILLGANDGIFPADCTSSGLLSERERALLSKLGIVLSESASELSYDELFLAYCAICSASETVYIMYSDETSDGTKLYPSVIVRAAKCLTGCREYVYESRSLSERFAGNEALFEQYITLPEGKTKATLEAYFSSIPSYKKRLDELKHSFYDDGKLTEYGLHNLYSDEMYTSYSRLEKFNECPFNHFCVYTLRLRPEAKAVLGPSQTGTIMHAVLEKLVPKITQSKLNGTPMTYEEAYNEISLLLKEYFGTILPEGQQNVSSRVVYLYTRLSKLLCALAKNIIDELVQSDFTPEDFEISISPKGDIKPVPIELGEGRTLYVIGQIDRVDRYTKDGVSYIRIIDYKTGSKTFDKEDILAGFNLQMLLYMYSICASGKSKYGENTIPAGVLYTKVQNPDTSINLGYDDGKIRENYIPKASTSGVLLCDTNIISAMDYTGKGTFIPIKLSDVGTDKDNSTLTLEKMQELLQFAAQTSAQLAKEMYSGEKSAKPFKSQNIDACRFCDMQAVCQGYSEKRNGRKISNFEF